MKADFTRRQFLCSTGMGLVALGYGAGTVAVPASCWQSHACWFRAPHAELVGSKPNCRGRCVASSSISSTPTEYSKIIPSGPLK